MKTVVVIILERFADWEVALLAPALQQFTDYTVCYASIDKEVKTSMGNLQVQPDVAIDEIPAESAALVLVGAADSWRSLSEHDRKKIADLVRAFKQQNKVIGGICDGAYFLAANGLLNDCRHTANSLADIADLSAYTNRQHYIETKREAVYDGNIVTANATAFADFTIQMLCALDDVPESMIEQCRQMWK